MEQPNRGTIRLSRGSPLNKHQPQGSCNVIGQPLRKFAQSTTVASLVMAIVMGRPVSAWTAVAQFDPQRPVTIRILNQTPYPLEYGLSDPYPAQLTEVQTGQSIQLDEVPVPNCLAVNTPMLSPVQYGIQVDTANLVTVSVTTVNDASGDHCLDVHPSGALYVY